MKKIPELTPKRLAWGFTIIALCSVSIVPLVWAWPPRLWPQYRPDLFILTLTLIAVIWYTKLTYETLQQSRAKAHLSIRFRPEEPDWSVAKTGKGERVFYLRLRVENEGPATARTVEADIHDVRVMKDGAWSPIEPAFLHSNLEWTHLGTPHRAILGRHIPKLVNLAGVHPNRKLVFTISPDPLLKYHHLLPGKYRFCVTIAAENAPPVRQQYEIEFSGIWRDSKEEMLSEVVLREVHDCSLGTLAETAGAGKPSPMII